MRTMQAKQTQLTDKLVRKLFEIAAEGDLTPRQVLSLAADAIARRKSAQAAPAKGGGK